MTIKVALVAKNEFCTPVCVAAQENFASSIITFVKRWQRTKNTMTVAGFMIPLHHLLQNHQTLRNAGKASVTHTKNREKKINSKILSPQEDYKHPHDWEKNCTHINLAPV